MTGDELRALRELAGLKLREMAEIIGKDVGHLSRVERGERDATPALLAAYRSALSRTVGDVRRRNLLALPVMAAASITVNELIAHGFTSAINGRCAVDLWTARVADYGRDYMTAGARDLQSRLAGDLIVLQQQIEQPGLWAAAARLLAIYGKTTTDVNEAITWYRLAAVAADRSDQMDVRVWVRARAALALAYERAALPTAEDLADQANTLAAGRPSLGLLNALMARAHVHGARGQLVPAMRADDAARRVFDVVGSAEQMSDFGMPEWRMATIRSMLYARLGHPRAIGAQETADRTRPVELPRFATHIELHRALMLVRAGDRREGIAYARRAMAALPPERHSLSLRFMLAEVERKNS